MLIEVEWPNEILDHLRVKHALVDAADGVGVLGDALHGLDPVLRASAGPPLANTRMKARVGSTTSATIERPLTPEPRQAWHPGPLTYTWEASVKR